jgi:beta-ureidopropionase / N-carbamoyl-L-amino-acid hydrolase
VKKTSLPVNPDRLWANIMALAEFTEQERPFTRRSFSPLFQKARLWLADQFKAAGLEVRIDSGGNLIGRREGRNPKRGTIAIGSHSDTVPSGGRFDGIAGLASALEIARSLDERQERLSHNLEVIDFLAEEPSEYGLSCVGSRAMAGALEPTMLEFRAAGGESLDAALRRVGGSPDNLKSAKRSDIVAFVELHIEQGIVLERAALDIGVVSSIVGICRVELVFEGTADHAGTTPMSLRQDALVAASNSVLSVRRIAETLAIEADGYFVATVGILELSPGASNVVPGRCRLVVDIRSTDPSLTTRFLGALELETEAHATAARVRREPISIISKTDAVACDAEVQSTLRIAARHLGLKCADLPSGAGHDAALMARICRSGMTFVPCLQGKSHSPYEWSDRDQIAAGAAVVLNAVKLLDDLLSK